MGIGKKTRGTWQPNTALDEPKIQKTKRRKTISRDTPVVARTDGLCDMCIVFDKESASYSEGEDVSGCVIVELKESITIETLIVEFKGFASLKTGHQTSLATEDASVSMGTYYTASNALTRNRNTTLEAEDYFNQRICLYNRADANTDIMVLSGSHKYPFTAVVPWQLPSTLHGRYGSIDYVAKATLERPWQPNETVSKEMKITSVLDLNTLPYHVLEPVESHKAQRCGILCFCSGDIRVTLRLNRTAFIQGEIIGLNGEIENNTRFRLTRTSFRLIQKVRCHDDFGRSSNDEISVASVEKDSGVPSGSVEFWRERLLVPEVPPTGQKCCNAMDLGYCLRFTASTRLSSVAMEMDTDVVIGTVALHDPDNPTIASQSLYGEYFNAGFPDYNSNGSSSPITGSDNLGLDVAYFI